MGGMRFATRYYNKLMWLTVLFIVQEATSAAVQRPIFVVGNMANTATDVERLLTDGANALEVDVRFSQDGTAVRVYHGFPCDCWRNCEGETSFAEYLEYIRGIASVDGGKYQNKLGLLYLDLKAQDISQANYDQAGINVVNNLVQHLWRNVSVFNAVNVLIYVNGVAYEDVFKGALETIAALPNSSDWKQRVGFDFGPFLSFSSVENAFADLNITAHRWQGDGATNCIMDITGSLLISNIVSCRDGGGWNCDYVDKAYVWDVDSSNIIKRMIKAGSDAVVTNKPATVLQVLKQSDVAAVARIAGPQDSPWTRIIIKSQ